MDKAGDAVWGKAASPGPALTGGVWGLAGAGAAVVGKAANPPFGGVWGLGAAGGALAPEGWGEGPPKAGAANPGETEGAD